MNNIFKYIELGSTSKIVYIAGLILSIWLLSNLLHFDIITNITLFLLGIIIPSTNYKREFQNWIFPILVKLGISENWLLSKMTDVNDLREPLGSYRNPWSQEKQDAEDLAKDIQRANLEQALLLNELETTEWLDADLESPLKKKRKSRKKPKSTEM